MPKIEFEIKNDNTDKIIMMLGNKLPEVLKSIGSECVTYAQKNCPVDSGALRNSIAWATSEETGGHKKPGKGEPSEPKATPEKQYVYVGSNLEYAAAQEFGDFKHEVGRKHFLRDAATTHSKHYQEIIAAALKSME